MTKRIFRSICITAITVLLATLILIMGVLYDYFPGCKMSSCRIRLTWRPEEWRVREWIFSRAWIWTAAA